MPPPSREIVIEVGRAEQQYWRDLWHYRELFYFLAWRDVLVRYKQTIVGVAWSLIRPLTHLRDEGVLASDRAFDSALNAGPHGAVICFKQATSTKSTLCIFCPESFDLLWCRLGYQLPGPDFRFGRADGMNDANMVEAVQRNADGKYRHMSQRD